MKIWVVGPIAWDSVLFLENSFSDSGYTHVKKKSERPGGQGLNVSSGLKSANLDVQLVGYLGNDANAEKLENSIRALGLSTDFIAKFRVSTPHIMVLVDNKGERKMIGLEESYFSDVRLPVDQISESDVVVWTWWREDFTEDFKKCKAIGAKTIVGLAALNNPEIDADLFVGSSQEVGNAKLHDDRKVIVTNGAEGATFYHQGKSIYESANNVEVIDTTGAGDAFLSGVTFGVAHNFEIEECMRIGVNWSSASISSESSLPANWSEKYLEKNTHKIYRIS